MLRGMMIRQGSERSVIDYTPVSSGQRKIADLAADINLNDLTTTTNQQIDALVSMIRDLSDAQVVVVAADPAAEGGIGWNVGHLIAHVTASSEENTAVSSILARGIDLPFEPRLRAEVDWTTLTTTAACIQRLEESRRMRQGYLSAWPDQPRLDTHRTLPAGFAEMVGPINALGAALLGLVHEAGQFAQLHEIIAQAKAAA
jgi:DinB superfamily